MTMIFTVHLHQHLINQIPHAIRAAESTNHQNPDGNISASSITIPATIAKHPTVGPPGRCLRKKTAPLRIMCHYIIRGRRWFCDYFISQSFIFADIS